ncbi:response regulator [Botrimarina mediterranea]|uniref:Chemotaxis protein CheY n=1 Tax=Botrimarina mediterranea TaxID=2528022 RepID=A0A518K2C6_9BACT|nr:response regulator [Botrimarina mediterranea]QDV71961.1 Chemotaxis protein CheY [Botrimarina mediterranea]QDV76502.1 Chemotaxis protein CheY [Planctomycetes bacterium K2D]
MHVLVVDDSAMTRMVAKNCLKSLDITEISEAEDGVKALAALNSGTIDIVFSDWNMPNMSGIELLREVRKQWPSMPFVMITTEGSKDKVMEAIQNGVSDYLSKPFTPEALSEKLKKWVAVPA